MKTFFRYLENLEDWIMVLALSYMVIITFVEVLLRYILKSPISWAEESARYTQVWLIYISAGVCVRLQNHISADIVVTYLTPTARRFFNSIASLFTFCVLLVLFYLGVLLVKDFLKGGQSSPALGIPMYYIALAIPVGIGISMLRYLGIFLNVNSQEAPSPTK